MLGKYERVVEEGQKTIDLNPEFAIGYNTLAYGYAQLDRPLESEKVLQRAEARKLEFAGFGLLRYDLAFLRGDLAEMSRLAAVVRATSEGEDWIANHEAFALAHSGRVQQAKGKSTRAADFAQQAGRPEQGGSVRNGSRAVGRVLRQRAGSPAWSDGGSRVIEAARHQVRRSPGAGHLRRVFAMQQTGRRSGTQPPGRYGRQIQLSADAARASFAEPARSRKGRSTPGTGDRQRTGRASQQLCRILRSLVSGLRAWQSLSGRTSGADAAAQFQTILDHRGIVVSDPIGALAHLQLGRALDMSGDKPKAKAAYQDFLTLWKDADSNIPILAQAKAEYARLQ